MRTVNRVFLMGHLGRDAETKFTADGTGVTNFTMATNRRSKDAAGEWREVPEWHNCTMWRVSEALAPYLLKGTSVFIEGRIQTRSWEKDGEKRYSTEIVIEELILLGGGAKAAPVAKAPPSLGVDLDDLADIPF